MLNQGINGAVLQGGMASRTAALWACCQTHSLFMDSGATAARRTRSAAIYH